MLMGNHNRAEGPSDFIFFFVSLRSGSCLKPIMFETWWFCSSAGGGGSMKKTKQEVQRRRRRNIYNSVAAIQTAPLGSF